MKNVFLVTGATGFIGANLVRRLVNLGQTVNILVRDAKLNWRLHDIADKINVFECDIRDSKLQKIVDKLKPDYIFHTAAYGVPSDQDNILEMIDTNLKGTINLVNAVKRNPFKLFINTGTGGEYGIKNHAIKESEILEPIFDFAIIKTAITFYCQKEAIRNNLPIINFRLFTPYGSFENRKRLIPDVALNALDGIPIKVSNPKYVRDFIFIEDVVDSYLKATKIKHKLGEIYNIGSGKQYSVGNVVSIILKITKSSSEVQWGTVKKQARFIEPTKWQANISKAKAILEWYPENTMESGLEKTIHWLEKNRHLY